MSIAHDSDRIFEESDTPRPNRPDSKSARSEAPFSFAQARGLIGDLSRPNPRIYWTDFLVSILTGHAAIHLTFFLTQWYPERGWMIPAVIACYLITVIMYMRSLMFIHELIHLPKDGFKAFRFAWNALCGILFLVPSFLYYPHVDHHRRKHYGTEHDGEYLALSHSGRWMIVGFIVQALVIPFLGFFRFLIVSPICWLIPGARRWVHRHASTMLVDPTYQRTDASPELMRTVVIQEVVLLSYGVWYFSVATMSGPASGLIRSGSSVTPSHSESWCSTKCEPLGLIAGRTKGGEMTFQEQIIDSVNYPHHPWISELWGPIGTRYHALHHLFPRLPYHNLGEAHRRLVAGLPADSPYHQTIATSLTGEIKALWRRSAKSQRARSLVL